MDKIVLQANKRVRIGKKVKALRREGKLPAVLYGKDIDPTPISLDLRESSKVINNLTSSSIITIDVDGQEYPVLLRDKQRDTILGKYTHVDFQVVSMKENIRTTVRILLSGVSPAVKAYNGVVVNDLSEIDVECLPIDLPESIEVDISSLEEIGSSILVQDLDISDKVTVHSNPEDVIVTVTSTAEIVEEVDEEAIGDGDASEPEVIEKGKKEEEDEND